LQVAGEGDDSLTELERLPPGAKVLFRGQEPADFDTEQGNEALRKANVLLNCTGDKAILSTLWDKLPALKWLHSRSAGVDRFLFPELCTSDVPVTNARGVFSSSLAEYTMLGCMYFSKDVDRWKNSQKEHKWDRFVVGELRGQTLGIIGYGSIGESVAKLAKAFGMKVLAQRRRPELCKDDALVDEAFGSDQVAEVISRSDFICVAAALTPETKGMLGRKELEAALPHAILVNIGRGALIDEEALIDALRSKKLRGAALDVFTTEPLPASSPLWDLPNVLISSHNADITATFQHDSVRKFVDAVQPFMEGKAVDLHSVDKHAGY
ncbi:unnamed protein product, partial [Chrysoparadoxa australica]